MTKGGGKGGYVVFCDGQGGDKAPGLGDHERTRAMARCTTTRHALHPTPSSSIKSPWCVCGRADGQLAVHYRGRGPPSQERQVKAGGEPPDLLLRSQAHFDRYPTSGRLIRLGFCCFDCLFSCGTSNEGTSSTRRTCGEGGGGITPTASLFTHTHTHTHTRSRLRTHTTQLVCAEQPARAVGAA